MSASQGRCYVTLGSPENWHYAISEISKENELTPKYPDECNPQCLMVLGEKKKNGKILWAFPNAKDYKELEDNIKTYNEIYILAVSTARFGDTTPEEDKKNAEVYLSKIVALGKVTKDDLVGECSCQYWPNKDNNWNYKFFIEILAYLDPQNGREGFILKGFQPGSLKEIDCRLLFNILDLAIKSGIYKVPRCRGEDDVELFRKTIDELKGQFPAVAKVVEKVGAALYAGNVLLVGPPGVGKTTLAVEFAKRLTGGDYILATANALWFRRDVIGGETLREGSVVWKSGLLIKAYNRAAGNCGRPLLLIIDEINRADADKAFGEFFSIFRSPSPEDWEIPKSLVEEIEGYGDKADEEARAFLRNYREMGNAPLKRIRVLATMNTRDVRNLFLLGEALLRRFTIVKFDVGGNVFQTDDKDLYSAYQNMNRGGDIPPSALIHAERLKDAYKALGLAEPRAEELIEMSSGGFALRRRRKS